MSLLDFLEAKSDDVLLLEDDDKDDGLYAKVYDTNASNNTSTNPFMMMTTI